MPTGKQKQNSLPDVHGTFRKPWCILSLGFLFAPKLAPPLARTNADHKQNHAEHDVIGMGQATANGKTHRRKSKAWLTPNANRALGDLTCGYASRFQTAKGNAPIALNERTSASQVNSSVACADACANPCASLFPPYALLCAMRVMPLGKAPGLSSPHCSQIRAWHP